jgi:predicted nucleic-acid-binding protein
MAAAIDTNVLLRLLLRDHPVQVRDAEAFVANSVWLSHLVLAEAMWVLGSTYGHGQAAIAATVELLLQHEWIVVQEPDVVIRALTHFKAHRRINFSDCLILEIARKAGHAPLGTFDRSLAKLDGVQALGKAGA